MFGAQKKPKSPKGVSQDELAVSLEKSLAPFESMEEAQTVAQASLANQMSIALKGAPLSPSNTALPAARGLENVEPGVYDLHHDPKWASEIKDWEKVYEYGPRFKLPEPELGGKWELSQMLALVERLQFQADQPLHPLYVLHLLEDTRRQMAARDSPVNYVKVPYTDDKRAAGKEGKLVVVGDTHGQLEDVLWIFFKNFVPSNSTAYLFNGDIADRGVYALEIFVLVFGFSLVYPDRVWLNRGNHEDETINLDPHCGGFYEELICKYGPHIGARVHKTICSIYCHLPLATVINHKVFVVHGGLSRYPPESYFQVLSSISNREATLPEEPSSPRSMVMIDSLWADPDENNGLKKSPRGETLITFGPDITLRFLKENNFNLMIRSHQPPPDKDGVFMQHQGRLATVFSASNYCGWYGNQGGVVILKGSKLVVEIDRHFSPTFDQLQTVKIQSEDQGEKLMDHEERKKQSTQHEVASQRASQANIDTRLERAASQIRQKVARLILEHKTTLWSFFQQVPQKQPGCCTVEDFKDAMNVIMDSRYGVVPWDYIIMDFGFKDPITGLVDFARVLARFQVVLMYDKETSCAAKDGEQQGPNVNSLVHHRRSATALRKSRIDNLKAQGGHVMPPDVLLMKTSYWMEAMLSQLYEILLTEFGSTWKELGKKFGIDESSPLTPRVLAKMIHLIQAEGGGKTKITQEQAEALVRAVMSLRSRSTTMGGLSSSTMSMGRFLTAMQQCYTGVYGHHSRKLLTSKAAALLRLLGRSIHKEQGAAKKKISAGEASTDAMLKQFRKLDTSEKGQLSKKDFMAWVKETHGGNIESSLLEEVWKFADIKGNGEVNYLEFLSCFDLGEHMFSGEANPLGFSLMEDLTTWLYMNKHALMSSFQIFDKSSDFTVRKSEFKKVLECLTAKTKKAGSADSMIAILCDHICLTTKYVEYKSFLDNLMICDTVSGDTFT